LPVISTENLASEIAAIPDIVTYGRVTGVRGMLIEIGGAAGNLSVGARCTVLTRDNRKVVCEVIGFRDGQSLLMPFHSVEGIGLGCKAVVDPIPPLIRPTRAWLGRVIDAMGNPLDGKGPLPQGDSAYPLRNAPPPASERRVIDQRLDLGIRAINSFLTCCRGQRMGIFAASGVGKSVLLSMMARNTNSDVNVIGLIGERGREVREFISRDLGEEGLARSVLVVATSDESPLMRRQAAHLTLTMAEYFRDQDDDVLCMVDSITRFAMAQREIGLSAGEPPASKGYTPTVFAELPKLLERAGTGVGEGSITGLFTVLVEGDDHDEPVADAVRSILDGHIVLDRNIAERGRYPAINVLRSISRTMPDCNAEAESLLISRARSLLATYEDMAEMIRLGAYRTGSDEKVDEAIHYRDRLEAFLSQGKAENTSLADGFAALGEILGADAA
jgi:flagellum-specific ATP synthase